MWAKQEYAELCSPYKEGRGTAASDWAIQMSSSLSNRLLIGRAGGERGKKGLCYGRNGGNGNEAIGEGVGRWVAVSVATEGRISPSLKMVGWNVAS